MSIKKIDYFKKVGLSVLFVISLLFSFSHGVKAQLDITKVDPEKTSEEFRVTSGYESTDLNDGLYSVIANVIKAFIGLLGIIFVILIIYGGYLWLTAGGDEAQITKAKDTMQRAVIGLVIVVAAYSITYFVFQSLSNINSTAPALTGSG